MRKTTMTGAAALLVSAGVAGAGELGDVGLVFQNGELVTGIGDDVAGTISDIGERVFGAEMSFDNTTGIGTGDDPGFFTNSASGIAVGSTIRYDTVAALQQWTGSGFGATGATLLQVQGLSQIATPGTDQVVAGYDYTYNGGDFDEHPDYVLDSGAGVYLWQIEFDLLDGSGTLLDRSETIFIVFNNGLADSELDAAIDFVETNIVPTPGAVSALALGGLLASRRRR